MIQPQNLRIVVVEPEQARNIGAVVRVAANFGLPSITVVQSHELADEGLKDIRIASSGAVDFVDVRVMPTLLQAISSADAVLGTSGRHRSEVGLPVVASVAQFLDADEIPPTSTLAVVFGRESAGLTNTELKLCHGLLRLPVSEKFSSMNLSHAITLVIYQALFGKLGPRPYSSAETNETQAPTDLQERWLGEYKEILSGDEAQMRRLLHRAKPTPEDMAMLFNMIKGCRKNKAAD